MHPVDRRLSLSSVNLAEHQTPIRQQGNRSACWAFAALAAIEAAYKREHNLTLCLSTEYMISMLATANLQCAKKRPYEHPSSLWNASASCLLTIRGTHTFFLPQENLCPYFSQQSLEQLALAIPETAGLTNFSSETTMQKAIDALEFDSRHISEEARYSAKYGAEASILLSRIDCDSLESILASEREIVAYFVLEWKKNPSTQVYDYEKSKRAPSAHTMLIIGYDREKQIFTIKNSWGESSFIQVSYEFVRKCIKSAFWIKKVRDPMLPAQSEAAFLGKWYISGDRYRGVLMLRRFANLNSLFPTLSTRLGSYYDSSNRRYDVNGSIKGSRISFSIAPTTAETEPGRAYEDQLTGNFDPENPSVFSGILQTGSCASRFRCSRNSLDHCVVPPSPSIFPRRQELGQWIRNCHERSRGLDYKETALQVFPSRMEVAENPIILVLYPIARVSFVSV